MPKAGKEGKKRKGEKKVTRVSKWHKWPKKFSPLGKSTLEFSIIITIKVPPNLGVRFRALQLCGGFLTLLNYQMGSTLPFPFCNCNIKTYVCVYMSKHKNTNCPFALMYSRSGVIDHTTSCLFNLTTQDTINPASSNS